jgi:hypothetical protein
MTDWLAENSRENTGYEAGTSTAAPGATFASGLATLDQVDMLKKEEARRANLVAVLHELENDGVSRLPTKAEALGVEHIDLTRVLRGATMCDRVALAIEWAVQKPAGWMDVDHGDDPLA